MIELRALFLVVVGVLGGCAHIRPADGAMGADTPALLVQISEASQQELQTTVARMMGVASVSLAQDALLATSLLVIEKNRPRGVDGIQLSGRDYDKPEQFRLLKSAKGCVLVRLRTGASEVLRKSQCRVEGI